MKEKIEEEKKEEEEDEEEKQQHHIPWDSPKRMREGNDHMRVQKEEGGSGLGLSL